MLNYDECQSCKYFRAFINERKYKLQYKRLTILEATKSSMQSCRSFLEYLIKWGNHRLRFKPILLFKYRYVKQPATR